MALNTRRIVVRASEAFAQDLERLADAERLSNAEVVRRAVALYALAREQAQQGQRLGFFLIGEDGTSTLKQVVAL